MNPMYKVYMSLLIQITEEWGFFCFFFRFYGISTFVDYLMLNSF